VVEQRNFTSSLGGTSSSQSEIKFLKIYNNLELSDRVSSPLQRVVSRRLCRAVHNFLLKLRGCLLNHLPGLMHMVRLGMGLADAEPERVLLV
jgi:hypothetical protein